MPFSSVFVTPQTYEDIKSWATEPDTEFREAVSRDWSEGFYGYSVTGYANIDNNHPLSEETNMSKDFQVINDGYVEGAWINLPNGATFGLVNKTQHSEHPYVCHYADTKRADVPTALSVCPDTGELRLQVVCAGKPEIIPIDKIRALILAARGLQ